MNAEDGRSAVPTDVEELLCRDSDIDFVVVFGSRSGTGTLRASSDLDIAVKFADERSASERFRKRCRLSGRLQRSDIPFVDLADIEDLPLEFARRAIEGELLCGDEAAYRAFAAEVETAYEERAERIERRQRERIRRIAEDGFHS